NKFKNRKFKIGSFTACSNVTGIITPYHEMAKIMHENGGLCFIDFAASAPYDKIDMHPEDSMAKLDAIYFSPHKFLGGPGSSGVLVFAAELVTNQVPDQPGGGTVDWTNPWGGYKYVDDIESREDGGTPGFLQAIRTGLAIRLKEQMGIDKMAIREAELVEVLFKALCNVDGLELLASDVKHRLGIISFYAHDIHYNLFVRLLNDRFGIQARGGCSCAGTYGHYLLHIDQEISKSISEMISLGDLSKKPGWVRMSVHPMMTNKEALYAANAIKEIIINIEEWEKDYYYIKGKNQFEHKERPLRIPIEEMFTL
nr:aminotransferase class V-fold PLP-dependent enzyme [Vallitaleaceae bacterium]